MGIYFSTEPTVKVGLYTDGQPETEISGSYTILHNLLIGKDYHWQQRIRAELPGRILFPETPVGEGIGLINILPAEEYLRCVTTSEMSPAAPAEFLKAHAIIARSWLLHKLSARLAGRTNGLPAHGGRSDTPSEFIGWDDDATHTGFDVCSDDHCQRYQGRRELPAAVADAILGTRGTALVDNRGNIIDARYSKCCGGMTEDFSTAWQDHNPYYLRGHADPYCDLSDMPSSERMKFLSDILKDYDRNPEPLSDWTRTISKKEIESNLKNKFNRDIGEITGLEIIERGVSGRASRLRIFGRNGNLILGKELMIRRLLSDSHLYSSLIRLEDTGDSIRIHGRGWGHGVGMCQVGAAHMALKGASCNEILSFYYPGTKTKRLYE